MKKIFILFVFLYVLFFPVPIFADDGETEKLYMNISILENGDIKVQELASLEGEYNGRLRAISFRNSSLKEFTGAVDDFEGSLIYNGNAIENLVISDVKNRDSITFASLFDESLRGQTYRKTENGFNGMKGYYVETLNEDGVHFKIYNPSSTNTAFYMEYVIKDAVVVHNDVAELAWNILGNTYEDNIHHLEVHIDLPQKDSTMRVFLRGPLNGNIEKVDGEYAKITYDFLGARNALSTRIVFDKSLVFSATKLSYVDGLESILAVEKRASDKANAIRDRIKLQNNIVKGFSIFWYFLLAFLFILFLRYKKRNEKCDFDLEYLRDFPYAYGPATLEYLLDKRITEKSMSASILMIIEKKALKVETNTDKKNNYTLVRVEEYEKDLTEEEKILYTFFLDKIGNGERVTLNEIKKYGKNYKNADKMMKAYNKWMNKCSKKAKDENFYRSSVGIKNTLVVILLLGILLGVLNFAFETGFLVGYFLPFVSAILLLVVLMTVFRTEKGVLHHKKWMALKKFMVDFGAMDIKELPEISIWGKYLVYATVLGCARELEKTMKVRMNEISNDESLASFYMFDRFSDNIFLMSSISSSIHNSVLGAVASSRSSIATSNSSSSSGGGGGASFGGGSFGGGGGGGHF